jgi:hypothetical protein
MAPPRQKNVVGMNLWCAQTCVSADPRGAADAVAGIDRPLTAHRTRTHQRPSWSRAGLSRPAAP